VHLSFIDYSLQLCDTRHLPRYFEGVTYAFVMKISNKQSAQNYSAWSTAIAQPVYYLGWSNQIMPIWTRPFLQMCSDSNSKKMQPY